VSRFDDAVTSRRKSSPYATLGMTWVSRASRLLDGAAGWLVALAFLVLPSAFHIDSPMRHGDALVTPRSDATLRPSGARQRLTT
jgi:hypothetical protein